MNPLNLRPNEFGTHTGTDGTTPTQELKSRQMVWVSASQTQMEFQMFFLNRHSLSPGHFAVRMTFRAQSATIMKSRVIFLCEWIFN
jgi:hypothetical protein